MMEVIHDPVVFTRTRCISDSAIDDAFIDDNSHYPKPIRITKAAIEAGPTIEWDGKDDNMPWVFGSNLNRRNIYIEGDATVTREDLQSVVWENAPALNHRWKLREVTVVMTDMARRCMLIAYEEHVRVQYPREKADDILQYLRPKKQIKTGD